MDQEEKPWTKTWRFINERSAKPALPKPRESDDRGWLIRRIVQLYPPFDGDDLAARRRLSRWTTGDLQRFAASIELGTFNASLKRAGD